MEMEDNVGARAWTPPLPSPPPKKNTPYALLPDMNRTILWSNRRIEDATCLLLDDGSLGSGVDKMQNAAAATEGGDGGLINLSGR